MSIDWTKSKIPGLEYRDYGADGKSWRMRQMVAGERKQDFLGLMTEEEAGVIAAKLRQNRKLGVGPQTFKGIEAEEREAIQAQAIINEKERKKIIERNEFEKANTIVKFWNVIYWPKRLKEKHNTHSNTTILGIFNNHIKPVIGNMTFQDLTFLDVDQIRINMENAGKSPQTQKHARSILRAAWNYARKYYAAKYKMELLAFPGQIATKIELDNEKKCWLEKSEAMLLLKTLKSWRECCKRHGIHCKGEDTEDAYGMAVLSLFSGLRLGDICNLTWGDVESREITYARNPKGGKAYGVHINIGLVKDMLHDRRSKLKKHPKPSDFVFKTFDGRKRSEAPKVFKHVIDELGFNYTPRRYNNALEKIDFHALRHTFASWLAIRGTSLYEIMELMGHKSLAMTLRYARLDPSKTRQSVEDLCWDFKEMERNAEGKREQNYMQ